MMRFTPLISIVIPVYNGNNYLRDAITSALEQTYAHCEVIVVNDGSADDGATEAIAKSYGDRIRYYHKQNGGVASALNLGVKEMRGDYLAWLSHDDVFMQDKIERQVNYLASMENRRVLLCADYVAIDAGGRELFAFKVDGMLVKEKPLYAVFRHMINGCTTLIPRDVFQQVGCFANFAVTQDYDMWFRLARAIPFRHFPEPVLYSRQHAEQGSQKQDWGEINSFWISKMTELTESEILRLEVSRARFFQRMARLFCDESTLAVRQFALKQLPLGVRLRTMIPSRALAKKTLQHLGLWQYARAIKRAWSHDAPLSALKNNITHGEGER